MSEWLAYTEVSYYKLATDSSYHYEFRYQFVNNGSSHRLMLLLGGHKRRCIDWWMFSVGRRILSEILSSNYSLLTVCSPKSTFDYNLPLEENRDVLWIYKSLQIWMNEVYFHKYKQYPSLYLYGVSRGSHFAGLLCRVLPLQAQILYIYPGYLDGMMARSILPTEIQTRLSMDSSYASWFHFKFCFLKTSPLCIFHDNTRFKFNPLPPTYFVHVLNDAKLHTSDYEKVILAIRNQSYELGGFILNNTESIKFHISSPRGATPSYMQMYFYEWRNKPHFSELLYEHLIGYPKFPEQQNSPYSFRTFWCHNADFTFFRRYPEILHTWTEKEQNVYHQYTADLTRYHELLTEEFCGDLLGQHAMLSLDMAKSLLWLNVIDFLRYSYEARPTTI